MWNEGPLNETVPLIQAAYKGDTELVKTLLDEGADIEAKGQPKRKVKNAKDSAGGTALMVAARYGQEEMVKLLLEKGADIKAKNNNGYTSLMGAAADGRAEIVKILIDAGADVNYESKVRGGGWTALNLAAVQSRNKTVGHYKAVKILLDAGADVNATDSFGMTPLIRAIADDNKDIVKLLLEESADVMPKGVWCSPITSCTKYVHNTIDI